jgi:CRISPR/Cas system-associated exonuclease Cas4 (RecB family)
VNPGYGWVSASDLAEYAYCPRALYYRRRYPHAPETAAEASGRRYHEHVLRAERRRADYPAALWAGVLLGLVLAGGAAVLSLEGVHP